MLELSSLVFVATLLFTSGGRWLRNNPGVCTAAAFPTHHNTKVREAETRCWCKGSAQRVRLGDFSQSRLLINFQIIGVKVTAAAFHRGTDKPASINIPVSGCRSGWYRIHGLIPSLPQPQHRRRRCSCHVNFILRGSQMSSNSASPAAGETAC